MSSSLILVQFLIGPTPTDERIVSFEKKEEESILVLQDSPPNYIHVSAEFMDGWTWSFEHKPGSTTTFVLNQKKRHVDVSGGVYGINNLALTVREVRTVGLPCADAKPMMLTEAGVFMLHPQLRVKVNQRLVCNVGGGVVYLNSPTEIHAVQITFGQHWSASQAEVITNLWHADH